jgi:hypothetical protein
VTEQAQNPQSEAKPLLSSNKYDKIKMAAVLGFPLVITLYLTLANIWNWPNREEIAATLGGVNVFLGGVVVVASKVWNKSDAKYDGEITVVEDQETGVRTGAIILNNYENPADVVNQKEVLFKVNEVKQ